MLREGGVSEIEKVENSKADGIITDFCAEGVAPARVEARLDAGLAKHIAGLSLTSISARACSRSSGSALSRFRAAVS